jgi:hypothetical protein
MRSILPTALAVLFAAGALDVAAQAPADDPTADAPTVPYVPAWIPKSPGVPAAQREGGRNLAPGPELAYVAEPAASASRTTGLDGELANSIAQAISADPAMKNAKITVQPDSDGTIVLTGVAVNHAQAQRAVEIATSHAGEGTVVNVIQDAET